MVSQESDTTEWLSLYIYIYIYIHTHTHTHIYIYIFFFFPGGSVVKNLPAIQETQVWGDGNGYPLQYSCLGNPMDRGAWWATVHGVAKSQAWLTDSTTTKKYIYVYILFQKGHTVLKALRKNLFHAFQFRMHSMTCSRMTPISTSAVTWHSSFYVSGSSMWPFFFISTLVPVD